MEEKTELGKTSRKWSSGIKGENGDGGLEGERRIFKVDRRENGARVGSQMKMEMG